MLLIDVSVVLLHRQFKSYVVLYFVVVIYECFFVNVIYWQQYSGIFTSAYFFNTESGFLIELIRIPNLKIDGNIGNKHNFINFRKLYSVFVWHLS